MDTAALYELDFAEWARQNAELLRSGRIGENFPSFCPYTLEQLQDEQFLSCTQR